MQNLSKINKKIFWVIILGFVLRIVVLDQSLWLDESIGAWAVKNFSYKGIVHDFLLSDNHPPLYYLVLKFWTSIFGYSEISLRMPSVIFGLGTIYFTNLIAKFIFIHPRGGIHIDNKLKNSTQGEGNNQSLTTDYWSLISALLLATSPLHIYYSQEARMYSMAALFAAASIYFFIKLLDKDKTVQVADLQSLRYWIFFSISIAALVFTDYMPVFLLPVFGIVALSKIKNKNWLKNFLLAFIPLIVVGILWVPTFIIQSEKGKWLLQTLPAWRELAGGASFKQAALVGMKFVLGRISFSPKGVYYLLVALGSLPFLVSFIKLLKNFNLNNLKKMDPRLQTVILWFFAPLIIGFAASFFFPAFNYFRYVYVLPAFYLLTTVGISKFTSINLQKVLIAGVILANLTGLSVYYVDEDQHREDWRSAAAFIDQTVENDDAVLFSYPQPFTPYRWYSSNNVSFGATNSISADSEKTSEITNRLIKNKNRVFYFDYLKDLSDPQNIVQSTIKENGYEEKQVVNFRGVGQVRVWEK